MAIGGLLGNTMPAKAYDVWFQAANTVYRGVPHSVVTDWAQQGRVSAEDQVRAAGSDEGWLRPGAPPDLADFLFVRGGIGGVPAVAARPGEELGPVEMDVGWTKTKLDED